MGRAHTFLPLALAALLLGPGALPLRLALGDSATEARTPAEIYERKGRIADCLEYVAKDLKARQEADKSQASAQLLLVVDPTSSMKDEIAAMQAGLEAAYRAGPPGMRIGVYGIQADEVLPPTTIARKVSGSLEALAFLPVNGPKNLMAHVRAAARRFDEDRGEGPRALLLVTQEGGEAEDDVEKTREAVFDAGCAFYCIAGEAAFERPWVQTFTPRDYAAFALTERFNPEPRKRPQGALFYGGEAAVGLLPYTWEHDLAQMSFYWVKPPKYPVPSGFGFWGFASLAYTSGGRYFVYDFSAPALSKKQNARRKSLYDFSRLAHLAPDLRPRSRILKDLGKDWRARTIVRIWEHLANEAVPVIQDIGNLELKGSRLAFRPSRPVRSASRMPTWLTDMDEVKKAKGYIRERQEAVHKALKWWNAANGKERTVPAGADPLRERIEADFQLLGVHLRKVCFHLGEALAALDSIKPLDVTYRRARILPKQLLVGTKLPSKKIDLEDEDRNAAFAAAFLSQGRVARRWPNTPWSLVLEKGRMLTFYKDVRIIEPERKVKKQKPKAGKGKKDQPPAPAPKPKPKPAPGPRPGSGSGGPVTGR